MAERYGQVAGSSAGRHGVVGRLNAEWAWLADDPAGAEACRRWADGVPALRGSTCLGQVLERVSSAPDEVLAALLAAAVAGDTLAARVVLQSMLGKLVRMAMSDRDAEVDDYVAVLWCTVATYPLASRPSRIAANLALDTLKGVHRERRPGHVGPSSPDKVAEVAELRPAAVVTMADERHEPDMAASTLIQAAERCALVDAETGALLRSVYADGLSGHSAALRHGTSPGAVRVRCSRALRVLAQHAPVLAEVA